MSTSKREAYLAEKHVKGFVSFLSDVISGKIRLVFDLSVAKKTAPPSFARRDGVKSVKYYFIMKPDRLEEFFGFYAWGRHGFDENERSLHDVQSKLKGAIELDGSVQSFREACEALFSWGFSKKDADRYIGKMCILGEQLPSALETGRCVLESDNPDWSKFKSQSNMSDGKPTMNAAWTKYYSLMLDNLLIYDGRVGAALGYLVVLYLNGLKPNESCKSVPDSLSFKFANGQGRKNRDPSVGAFVFEELGYGANGSAEWARLNSWASWIVLEAIKKAVASGLEGAEWVRSNDALRRVEAALFMLGYDLPPAEKNPQ